MASIIDKRTFTILICTSMSLLFADQNLLAPNLSLIAEEFGFSAEERDEKLGGEIALGFFMIGGIVSIFIGNFDRLLLLYYLTTKLVHLFLYVLIFIYLFYLLILNFLTT